MTVKNGGSVTVTNPLARTCTLVIKAEGQEIYRDTDKLESFDFYPEDGWEDMFLDKIPNSMTGTWSCEVTYSGHTITKSATYSAAGYNPKITAVTYADTNSTAQAIIQDTSKILQNISTPEFAVTGTTSYGATITQCSVTILGTTVTASGTSAQYGTINSATNVTATVKATDSRGNVGSKNVTVTMTAYEMPSAIITLKRQNNYYSETDLTVDASVMDAGSNVPTITGQYKEKGGSTWTTWPNIQDNVTNTQLLDNTLEWDVQVTVTDSFGGTVTYNLSVGIGLPIWFFDRNMRSVGMNTFPTEPNQMLINSNLFANNIGAVEGHVNGSSSIANKSIATGTVTEIGSFELPAGLWIVKIHTRWSANATGYRMVNVSTTSADSDGLSIWNNCQCCRL